MNSTYDYDPASRKDELVDMVKKALENHGTCAATRPRRCRSSVSLM